MANVTSSIQLKRHTGSLPSRPSTLNEGEFAIDFANRGHLFYGATASNSSAISSSFTFNDLALSSSEDYALKVTGSTKLLGDLTVKGTASFDVLLTNYESSSIIYSSGSTKFGDTIDDTHQRTGSMFISGNVSGVTASFDKYVGVEQTKYKTGSTPVEDLLQLNILNFDSNVFVTSDPTTGQLTLQFGEINVPSTVISTTIFNSDRFSTGGTSKASHAITSSWNEVPGVTYLSHSFLAYDRDANISLEISTRDLTSNNPLSHSYFANRVVSPQPFGVTGSYLGQWNYTSSLHIIDGAGNYTDVITGSGDLFELNKLDPNRPTVAFHYSDNGATFIPNGNTLVQNSTNISNDSNVEKGVKGIVKLVINRSNQNNDWYSLPLSSPTSSITAGGGSWTTTDGETFTATITETSTLSSLTIESRFTSSTDTLWGGFPATKALQPISSKAYNRIITPRVGFSANSSSLDEDDFNDLNNWLSGSEIQDGQVINFPTTNPNNVTFTANVTSTDKYLYIVYDDNQSNLTQIVQSNQNVIDQFTSPTTVGDYKYYRSTNKVVAPNTFTAELKTS